jgi:hypothetical protein
VIQIVLSVVVIQARYKTRPKFGQSGGFLWKLTGQKYGFVLMLLVAVIERKGFTALYYIDGTLKLMLYSLTMFTSRE